MSQEAIKIVYCAYFHSTVSNGTVFWRNLENTKHFQNAKEEIRIITGSKNTDTSTDLF
jgi:hypothetical protein